MATVTCSAASGAKALQMLAMRLEPSLVAAQRANIRRAKAGLVKASSGTLTLEDERKLGHPFAVRDPITPINSAIINDQGGPFKGDWQAREPEVEHTADGETIVTARCDNTSPEAAFMGGTRTEIVRKVTESVAAQIAPEVRDRVRKGMKSAIDAAVKASQ